MRLLVLGGTAFVGRHLVEAALAAGHEVSTFTRGRTRPGLHPEVEELRGDRAGDLAALRGRAWDAVADVSGYLPADVRRAAALLAPAVGHALFVSTVSVYRDDAPVPVVEDAPLARLPPGAPEVLTAETYGALKALGEEAVREAFPGRATVIRPGIVAGPHDRTNRVGHWVRRVADGGEVLAPGPAEAPLQLVDARDLAAFALRLLEAGTPGTFNVVGGAAGDGLLPDEEPLTWGAFLGTVRTATASDARLTWVEPAALLDAGLRPWEDLPLWLPPDLDAAVFRVDTTSARRAGLVLRPLAETARDTLAWMRAEPDLAVAGAGLAADPRRLPRPREAELLAAWHRRGP